MAELAASLSLACDLANSFRPEKGLRNCLVALRIAEALGLGGQALSDAYYIGLLRSIGCTSFAHEEAALAGDDIAFRNTFAGIDFGRPPEVLARAVTQLGKGSGPINRARAVTGFIAKGQKFGASMASANCEAGARLAERLGMGNAVVEGLLNIYERWDGAGVPKGLREDEIPLTSLLGNLSHVVTVHHRPGRNSETKEIVKRRRATEFEPSMADAFAGIADDLLQEIESDSVWEAVLDVEPRPQLSWPHSKLDEVARAFGHFTDLKSPFMLGHSQGVSDLAAEAARQMKVSASDVMSVRIAGLLHDLGRVSVPNSIWEKPGPLSSSEWERVRLHAYYTERVLEQSAMSPYARIAGTHHERVDESGYHRGLPAALLTPQARVLAAADVFQAMTETRPHRAAIAQKLASEQIKAMAIDGVLDHDAVVAVLSAAGEKVRLPKSAFPAGLSRREVEVLGFLARGLSNKQIAGELTISEHTIHHHVLHIYQKTGLSTRAAAALFAMENDLLQP